MSAQLFVAHGVCAQCCALIPVEADAYGDFHDPVCRACWLNPKTWPSDERAPDQVKAVEAARQAVEDARDEVEEAERELWRAEGELLDAEKALEESLAGPAGGARLAEMACLPLGLDE